jgi:hypothetical protein
MMRQTPPVSAGEGLRETGRFPAPVSSPHAAISAVRAVRRHRKKGAREGNMVSLTGARNARDAMTGGRRQETAA